jgi:hypothetical protein
MNMFVRFLLGNNLKQFEINGITVINSSQRTVDKCTWACHNDTEYCKENHVKTLHPFLSAISVAGCWTCYRLLHSEEEIEGSRSLV